jgi:hypothetical protein
MNKLVAVIQLIGSALISIAALAMLVNLIFIATRPETISVINAMIGGGVLVVCLPVIFKKGVAGLKQEKLAESPDTAA